MELNGVIPKHLFEHLFEIGKVGMIAGRKSNSFVVTARFDVVEAGSEDRRVESLCDLLIEVIETSILDDVLAKGTGRELAVK